MTLDVGARFGSFEILASLGAGGMGEVYRARDLRLDREVALKVLPAVVARDQDCIARFQREGRLLASLNHPAIATLYGVEDTPQGPVLAMELVSGETLAERLRRGPLPVEAAIALMQQVAAGLEAAHERGLIHRDVKPGNLMVTPEQKVKILDFGLAKAIAPQAPATDPASSPTLSAIHTAAGVIQGTAAYMSPEQARGLDLDRRTDIWSFGCVLYEALTARRAFPGSTVSDAIASLLTREPDWDLLPRATPPAVVRLLRHCLQKDREVRLATIGDACRDLKEVRVQPGRPSQQAWPSIAVLPLLTLSADPEDEYFADGTTEDIIAQLSRVAGLKVISRTSVMVFKKRELPLREIAGKLGVGTILEGSVRRAGARVRIVAQLIDAQSDQHLWAETYDRDLTDIFAIQSEVARKIATSLRAELGAGEQAQLARPPRSLDAYRFHLKGRQCLQRYTEEGLRKALEYYQAAIREDPEYAVAHSSMALSHVILAFGFGGGEQTPMDSYAQAKSSLARALELEPDLAEAHVALGFTRFACDYDWDGATRAFDRAVELSPGYAFAHACRGLLMSALARYDEAIVAQRRAQELDPLQAVHSSDLATVLLRAGRHEEALREARRLVEVEPEFPMAHSTLGWACLRLGRVAEGLASLEKADALSPGNTLLRAQLGQAYAVAGRLDEAREVLRQLEQLAERRYVAPYHFAYVHAGLGDQDAAIDCLERAVAERAGGAYGIKGSFLFEGLRNHPRFQRLLLRMNLTAEPTVAIPAAEAP